MSYIYLPNSSNESLGAIATIADLKSNNTDYEWYPTTDSMIETVIKDVKTADGYNSAKTILDIGAGDGRVLEAFRADKTLYTPTLLAIEKSPNHVARWSKNITFVGGDFYESQVNSSKVDIAFSNPPYSDYENWTVTLIKNIRATVIYLILPERWVKSERIQAAIESRGLLAKVVATDDFSAADRKARGKINIVRLISEGFKRRIRLIEEGYKEASFGEYSFFRSNSGKDPVDVWFEEMFPRLAALTATQSNYTTSEASDVEDRTYQIFKTTNTIDDLVMLYQIQADKVLEAYRKINECDANVFIELQIDLSAIKETLKARMGGLRAKFWQAFIHNYKPITERLTAKYRDKILSTLITRAEDISFNTTNAFIVTQMVISRANEYSDDQVTDFFYKLSDPKTVTLYKSNQKVFSAEQWRYCSNPADRPSHYTLDYRIVQHRLFNEDSIVPTISDICIIARLVGMKVPKSCNGSQFDNAKIAMGERVSIDYTESGETKTLFDVKFYKNGNQHLFLNKEFALRLNIYIGKLLGWVSNTDEAFEQMKNKDNISKADFNKVFEETKIDKITMTSNKHLVGLLQAS